MIDVQALSVYELRDIARERYWEVLCAMHEVAVERWRAASIELATADGDLKVLSAQMDTLKVAIDRERQRQRESGRE